ncbi:MAG: divalent cation tolerance protein CutA, partial [Pyrinomonadaceae bacterium]
MASESSEPIAVFMTAANGEEATRLAEVLVVGHLAACVQILPEMESVYRWQGNIERQAEVLL